MQKGKVKQEKTRESNLELLRIISMFMILLHHYCIHSQFALGEGLYGNKFLIQALSLGGKIGVNIFILITGYFMIKSQFKLKKFIKLVFEVITYSVLFFLMAYFLNHSNFNIKLILKFVMPVTFEVYWFITTYLLLYLVSPFINQFIKSSSKEMLIKLIGLVLLLQVIIPTFTTSNLNFSNFIWFITLYIIGAYFRLNKETVLNHRKGNLLVLSGSVLTLLLAVISFDWLSISNAQLGSYATWFAGLNKLPAVAISISLFVLFKNWQLPYNKGINSIATTTLGIYLIHDNPFVRSVLWTKILKSNTFLHSPYLIVHCLLSVVAIFIIACLIDKIRQYTIEKWFMKFIDYIEHTQQKRFHQIKEKWKQVIETKL